MKLSHIVLTSALLITSYTMQSQTAPTAKKDEKTVSEKPKVTYEELKELYVKQQNSESFKKSQKLITAFVKKMNFNEEDATIFQTPGGQMEWIKANLDKTDFASYEEAVKENEEMMAATMEEVIENTEFYTALGKADPEDAQRVLMEGINPYTD